MFNFFVICRQSKWMKTLLMKETVVLCRHNTKTASPKAITWTATSASYFNSVHCHLIKTIFKSTKIIRTVFKVSTQLSTVKIPCQSLFLSLLADVCVKYDWNYYNQDNSNGGSTRNTCSF
jgi:hypothetical protein